MGLTMIIAPPTNQTAFNQWTVGAIFYSTMIIAEAFGTSNASQIVDTTGDRVFTPSYSIYEKGALARVALFNYNDDPTGAYAIKPKITIDGGKVPAQVKVKWVVPPPSQVNIIDPYSTDISMHPQSL
jgi:hypothetical protein